MGATGHPAADALLGELVPALRLALRSRLVGLYLYGSATGDDFDEAVSDVDLLAVTSSPVDDRGLARLAAVHADLVAHCPEWDDRVEVLYADPPSLAHVADGTGVVVRISPGEPLHRTLASPHWVLDLYAVRERGLTLLGTPPAAVVPTVTRAQLVEAARTNLVQWRDWVGEATTRRQQAYAVLTVCRNLYASRHGEQASKPAGARWAAAEHPLWADLIARALAWRRARDTAEDAAAYAETVRFVEFAIGQSGAS